MPPILTVSAPLPLPWALLAFLAVWFFALGGCVGSFLNVVIYRWPRGKSIVSPPSRCPHCGAHIRWYHNLPVLGWLMLRGKCFDCHAPIAARYPTVEFLIGLLFLLLAGQVLLPNGPQWLLTEPWNGLLEANWPRLALAFVYYQTLNVTLIAAAYIAWDGERLPLKLFVPALLLGLLVPLFWNEVRPDSLSPVSVQDTALLGLKEGLAGALVGCGLGLFFDAVRGLRDGAGVPRGMIMMAFTICGLMLGWKAVSLIAIASAVLAIVWLIATARRWPGACAAPLAGVALATIGVTLTGRLFWNPWSAVTAERSVILLVGAVAVLLISALIQHALSPSPSPKAT